MTTFQAGANGSNLLTAFFILSPITSDVASETAVNATYSNGMRSVLSGNFTLNDNGAITGGTLTGWTVYNADGSLDFSLTGFAVDVQISLSGGNIGSAILTTGITYRGSSNPNASDSLFGKGSDTFIAGAATELFKPAAGTNTIVGSAKTTVQFLGAMGTYSIVNNGDGSVTVTDSVGSRNGTDHISGAVTLKFTDVSTPLASDGTLILPASGAAQVVAWGHVGDTGPLTVWDSSANVLANLSGLEGLAAAGRISSISLLDSSTPTLTITPAQLSADLGVFNAITSSATLKVSASAANLTMTGAANLGTVAVFSGAAANYGVTSNGDGSVTVTDIATGRTSVDHLTNFSALQFSDQLAIIASTPATNGAVTGGNITELYSAALARTPDVAGLAFYLNYLKANPSTSLATFAQFFLSSPEYTSKHAYATSSQGDSQFIGDLYNNLLHRAPESQAVPFYEKVITGLVAHDTPGTAQYAADYASARAQVLTYVSQSPEFLSDVKVTGTPGPQHWLVVT